MAQAARLVALFPERPKVTKVTPRKGAWRCPVLHTLG
jgi:hypothetical protein